MALNKIDIELWEPEETIGKLWHSFASRLDAPLVHHGAAVDLSEVIGRLAVFFRGLGGDPSVEIRAISPEASRHRLSFLRSLGTDAETAPRASFDGEVLRLPEQLAIFPDRDANAALFLWLTGVAAHSQATLAPTDPLQADLAALGRAIEVTQQTLAAAPGLRSVHARLCHDYLQLRPGGRLPAEEDAIEALIRHALGSDAPLPALAETFAAAPDRARAPRRYRPFRPVPLWPDLRALEFSAETKVENPATDGAAESGSGQSRRARRRKADQVERNDSLILHKFEAILSWTEMMNLNRRVEDDDHDNAKKAADDQDEIGLGQISKAPATRLKLHLDLAPEDVDREALSGKATYPEWDVRSGTYLPNHVRVLHSLADATEEIQAFQHDPRAQRRIRQVKRQFEALRPGRVTLSGCLDGEELDTDAAVRAQVDLRACGAASNRIWRQSQKQARNLAVSILLDVSRSTESAVAGRSVIDIEREALTALAGGLDACGDDFAIHAFSSLKRDRVYVQECKGFAEPMSAQIDARIAGLRPGFYTRLGAALRHVSADLAYQSRQRRLLLVITDGKPNDLDHYEGRHGIEDTAMAVCEARRAGQSVFGVIVGQQSQAWFPRLFGAGGFHVIPDPDKLTQALPMIYRDLVMG